MNEDLELHETSEATNLDEMQKAFDQIEKHKQGEEIEEPTEGTEQSEAEEETEQLESEEEPEESKRPRKKKSYDVRREKYRLLTENEALRRQLQETKQVLEDSVYSGTYHYSQNVYSELEHAKAQVKQAINNGDADALATSISAVTNATNKINELEKLVPQEREDRGRQQSYSPSPERQTQPERQTSIQDELASDWMMEHPELDQQSEYYNPTLTKKVATFVNDLDQRIARSGKSHALYTPEYFDILDRFIHDVQTNKNNRQPESSRYVGGVRSQSRSINGSANSTTKIILTADEKRMAANSGVPEKIWLQHKIEEIRKQGNNR